MSNVNERLIEIEKMIEVLVKENCGESLLEVKRMMGWKREVREEVQSEQRKLDDIYYFLVGILFAKGLVKDWGGNGL
jgi:hypothetical protein